MTRMTPSPPPPHLVLPLTVEPPKPRLCNDARFLNLWMQEKPFKLDHVGDLPRYVSRNSYQSVLDDKSGYDHILLTDDSRTFFGIQWGGRYFTYNTLPFGWKISPYVYHNTGLVATNFFRSLTVPFLLYIDDRHNGQLQIPLEKGVYADIPTPGERRFAAAKSALFSCGLFFYSTWIFFRAGKICFESQNGCSLLRVFIGLSSTGVPPHSREEKQTLEINRGGPRR